MKFSVIIPVYNVEPYLEECVDSVLCQTCKDFEILLLDDGSTDKSGAICDAYAESYPECIRVFHQHNCGVFKTRIQGVKQAMGDVCIIIDSDDCLRGDALEKIKDAFEKTNCDMVLYGASAKQDFSGEDNMFLFENGRCFEGESKKELYTLMAVTSKLNALWTKATKKSVFDAFLPEYDADLVIANGQDLYFSLPLITEAKKITYLGERLYYYRQRMGSTVHSFSSKFHGYIKIVRQEVEKYIEHWGIQECYPAFYTRVVANWLQALKNLLKYQRVLSRSEIMTILQELAEDEFFRKAYNKMIITNLPQRDRLLAKSLYQKRFMGLRVVGKVFYFFRGMEQEESSGGKA